MPLICTCRSMRPKTSNPCTPQQPTSPEKYSSPKGATTRNLARSAGVAPRNFCLRPPKQICPLMPGSVTKLPAPSRSTTLAWICGWPTGALVVVGSQVVLQDVIAVSLAPYKLWRATCGQASWKRRTSAMASADPTEATCLRAPGPRAAKSSKTLAKKAGVHENAVAPWSRMSWAMYVGSFWPPGRAKMISPPVMSGENTCHSIMAQTIGDCMMDLLVEFSSQVLANSVAPCTTLSWVYRIALGLPVLPEVHTTTAPEVDGTETDEGTPGSISWPRRSMPSSLRRVTTGKPTQGPLRAGQLSVTTALALAKTMQSSCRFLGHSASTGTANPPQAMQPISATGIARQRSVATAMGKVSPKRRAARQTDSARTRSANSWYVICVPLSGSKTAICVE
mmetsp:Transcript_5922/g.18692  ORF Transcript_5922/g.18692 Transcript_5922/m.18692 type:complete len:394 (+) Transcript_5922:1620-2801(+)